MNWFDLILTSDLSSPFVLAYFELPVAGGLKCENKRGSLQQKTIFFFKTHIFMVFTAYLYLTCYNKHVHVKILKIDWILRKFQACQEKCCTLCAVIVKLCIHIIPFAHYILPVQKIGLFGWPFNSFIAFTPQPVETFFSLKMIMLTPKRWKFLFKFWHYFCDKIWKR